MQTRDETQRFQASDDNGHESNEHNFDTNTLKFAIKNTQNNITNLLKQ